MITNFRPYNRWLKRSTPVSEILKDAPMIMPHRHMARDNFILVGDAGGQTTPFFGEGIRPAFTMAHAAAKTIKDAFLNNNYSYSALNGYEQTWETEFGHKYLWSIIIRHIWAHEFSNQDIDHLVQNMGRLTKQEFYSFLRSDMSFDVLHKLIDIELLEDVIINFIRNHIPHLEPNEALEQAKQSRHAHNN